MRVYLITVGIITHLWLAIFILISSINYCLDSEVSLDTYSNIDRRYVSVYPHEEVLDKIKECLSDDKISGREYWQIKYLNDKLDNEVAKKRIAKLKERF